MRFPRQNRSILAKHAGFVEQFAKHGYDPDADREQLDRPDDPQEFR
jgi:hypothetical protein